MVDATKRKLKLPPWHVPYLEKYRILELFRELTRELVVNQPVDHVLFLKQIISNASSSRNVARVVILGSPKVNCLEVAKQISVETNQLVISEEMILGALNINSRIKLKLDVLVMAISKFTRSEKAYKSGWILVDCIKTPKEAKRMLEYGIIPTHTLHLIAQFDPPINELLYCRVHQKWPEYRRTVMGVRDALKNRLIEVHLGKKTLYEVVNTCMQVISIRQGPGPKQPRVLLLGPRGSGRKTQAKLLEKHLKLVYLDFEYLLCQAWISNTELGNKLRSFKHEVCFQSNLLVEVIEKRILEEDCLKNGWVLTGFPYTVTDFKYLDSLDTPPNRVIIIEVDLNICRERLLSRRVNVYTGSVTNIVEQPENLMLKRLSTHPKDKKGIINAELTYYCEQYGAIRNYCGGTTGVINGDQPERWVFECISATITRGTPICPPRDPCLEEKEKDSKTTISNTSTSSVSFTANV